MIILNKMITKKIKLLPGNVATMFECLYEKFMNNTDMYNNLIGTSNAFLLEHNEVEERDYIWSNNNNGHVSNLLGLLLITK